MMIFFIFNSLPVEKSQDIIDIIDIIDINSACNRYKFRIGDVSYRYVIFLLRTVFYTCLFDFITLVYLTLFPPQQIKNACGCACACVCARVCARARACARVYARVRACAY